MCTARSLNPFHVIVRDRTRCLSGMSEQEIVAESGKQGVTAVKMFQDEGVVPTNTYLFTFSCNEYNEYKSGCVCPQSNLMLQMSKVWP